jgi:hypothetical protein
MQQGSAPHDTIAAENQRFMTPKTTQLTLKNALEAIQ